MAVGPVESNEGIMSITEVGGVAGLFSMRCNSRQSLETYKEAEV